jgi:hypothetical protein
LVEDDDEKKLLKCVQVEKSKNKQTNIKKSCKASKAKQLCAENFSTFILQMQRNKVSPISSHVVVESVDLENPPKVMMKILFFFASSRSL